MSIDEKKKRVPLMYLNNKTLHLLPSDRTDPLVLMLLANVERVELKDKEGLIWYSHLRDNYGLRLEENLESQLLEILMS